MIDRTSSSTCTEFPALFGTTTTTTTYPSIASSSSTLPPPSCGMEAIVIQRPLYTESYSWSDFPMVVQEDDCSIPNYSNHSSCYDFGRMRSDDDSFSSSSSLYSSSSSSSSTSMASLASTATASSSHKSSTSVSQQQQQQQQQQQPPPPQEQQQQQQQQQQQPPRRNVRFAPSKVFRTYSLVLGDHPLCGDGLAIELGWDYNEEQQKDNDEFRSDGESEQQDCHHATMWTYPHSYYTNNNNNVGGASCQKRSYLSRKQLLLDVAGCTKEELDQRTKRLREERQHRAMQR